MLDRMTLLMFVVIGLVAVFVVVLLTQGYWIN